MNYDLSILIPARNEMFLAKTVENILENKRGKTQVIVVLDGQWADPPLTQHVDVVVVYLPESIGQRAATNLACRLSTAKYVMKCDAHVAFDEGFDVKMMAEMKDDWTMIPRMYNLHAFDWVCKCGLRLYQGPTPVSCEKCGGKMEREIVWKPRLNRRSDSMRFDNTLHFQYWGSFESRPEAQGDVAPTMSLLGACFMLTREKYWELDICDEKHGSWGQQGTEVACKTWLSGGQLMVNKKTWFAHMFRTQGGDFGFPYPNTSVQQARNYSKELWLDGKWEKAKYPLSWLIDKFAPVPGWEDVTKGILYYTDNRLDEDVAIACQKQLLKGVGENKLVSVSLRPIEFGDNLTLPLERGYLTMFKQILAGLEKLTTDVVFFCEHDVYYHPSHFDFTPPKKNVYYYNTNTWKIRLNDGHALYYYTRQLSGLCAYRELLIQHFKERIRRVEAEGFSRKMGFEPGTHRRKERVDDFTSEDWRSKAPNLDLRHNLNLTKSRWKQSDFRDLRNCRDWQESHISKIEGWDNLKEIMKLVVK